MTVVEHQAIWSCWLHGYLELQPRESVFSKSPVSKITGAVEGGHLEVDSNLAQVPGEPQGAQAHRRAFTGETLAAVLAWHSATPVCCALL